MEMLSMGPGRRSDDSLLQVADDDDAEPVDLGVRSRSAAHDASDAAETRPDADTSWEESGGLHEDHWLSGLARADVLGVSGAGVLLLLALGLPVLSMLQNFPFYGGPVQAGLAWSFAPSLVAAAAAAGLGFGGMRQAARYGATSWARVTSGVAAVVGAIFAVGIAVLWFAASQADLVNQLR